MTSTHTQEMLRRAEEFADGLISSSRSDVAAKLQAVDEACRSIIKSGGTVSVSSVRGWLITNRGITIGASTLMNRRTNPRTGDATYSPARLIIDEYIKVQKTTIKRVTKKQKVETSFGFLVLSDAEMREIEDHQVRYKVQLLAGRVRNLETQLNQVRTISSLPVLSTAGMSKSYSQIEEEQSSMLGRSQDLALEEEEVEALNDFLDDSSMGRRKVGFDKNGTLQTTRPANPKTTTIAISKPFLEGALRKILRSYGQE